MLWSNLYSIISTYFVIPKYSYLVNLNIQGPYSQSFVDVIGHPWVVAHADTLRNIDAKEALCNRDSLTRTELPLIPNDLFESLRIDNDRLEYVFGWHNAKHVLEEILGCPEALRTCQRLRVNINRRGKSKYDSLHEPVVPPKELPGLLIEVISRMPQLEQISWHGPSDADEAMRVFEAAFQHANATSPSLKRLKLSPYAHFLAAAAPNLESLSTSDWTYYLPPNWRLGDNYDEARFKLIEAAGKCKKLKTFGMYAKWSPSLVQRCLNVFPDIETLYLDGSIWKPYDPTSYFPWKGRDGKYIKDTLATVKKFKNLTSLRLPNANGLSLTEHIVGCGNPYLFAFGRKNLRRDLRDVISEIEIAGNIVLTELPHLKNATIGGITANVEDGNKTGSLVWPWTGRMREYLLQEYPRYKGGVGERDEDPDGPVFGSWKTDEQLLDETWGRFALEGEAYDPAEEEGIYGFDEFGEMEQGD